MSDRRKLEIDQDRVTVLLLINSLLIKKAHSIYATILSNRQTIQQLQPQNRQSILEQYNNINRRLQCNLSVLSYINDTYVNEEAARQPNRLQFPVILSTPPEMPELRLLYKRLQDLYPEAMQFLKLKIQQMKKQQEAQGRSTQGNPQNAGSALNPGLQTPQGLPSANMQGFQDFGQGMNSQSSQSIQTPLTMQNPQNVQASQNTSLQTMQGIQNQTQSNQVFQNRGNTQSFQNITNTQSTPNLQNIQGMPTPRNIQGTQNFQNNLNGLQINHQNLYNQQGTRNGNMTPHMRASAQQVLPQGLQSQQPLQQQHGSVQSMAQNQPFNQFSMPQNHPQQQFQSPQMNLLHPNPGSVTGNTGQKQVSQGQQHMQLNPAQLLLNQPKFNKLPTELPFASGISPQMMTKEPELLAFVDLSTFGAGVYKNQDKNTAAILSISPQQILQQLGQHDVSLDFF